MPDLTAADGVSVADFAAGHIGFLANGALIAETGQNLAAYDLATGVKLDDIAFTTGDEFMGNSLLTRTTPSTCSHRVGAICQIRSVRFMPSRC